MLFFFFNDTATTEIYTLSLHDALPIYVNAPRLAYGPHKSFIDPEVGERLHVLQDDRVRFYGQPIAVVVADTLDHAERADRKSTRLNSSHANISYAVFCLKKKKHALNIH